MIIQNLLSFIRNEAPPPAATVPAQMLDWGWRSTSTTVSGKRVTAETAMTIATAYRCGNILSDDIASMPLQVFQRMGRNIEQIQPDPVIRNLAYLLEISPNRWMAPFIFKKTIVQWLVHWGNAYIWQPPGSYREWFILRADSTYPTFDGDGDLWFKSFTPSGNWLTIPAVEVTHLMINSTDGFVGRSVITYAAETMGRQLGAHETMNRISGQGLNPAGAMYVAGAVTAEAREKLKRAYLDGVNGGVVVFDDKISKFEPVTMKPTDAQFLESIEATDAEIANFFGMPLYKLNMGKQSYESNEQQNLDYLRTTLNPYLVQWEQAGRLKWIPAGEQRFTYLKFNREALLQTDAKTRSEYLTNQIFAGLLTPNEGRAINDLSAYPGGDLHYIPANMTAIERPKENVNEG
jgi:HK97 family phage portal protein